MIYVVTLELKFSFFGIFFMANNTKILNTDTIFGVKGAALHKLNGGENVIYHRLNNLEATVSKSLWRKSQTT